MGAFLEVLQYLQAQLPSFKIVNVVNINVIQSNFLAFFYQTQYVC